MAKTITADELIARHVRRKDRVLLVNPPVEETRYSWIRWNQPLDLLKLGAFLHRKKGCVVELFDCMKPTPDGKVREDWLPRDQRYYTVKGERYPMRRFGEPASGIAEFVRKRLSESPKSVPTQVWITSLCSYWYVSIAECCRVIRQVLPDAQIALIGQYPRLMLEHAAESCPADFVISTSLDLADEPWNLDLYGDEKPPFIAVTLHPKAAIEAVRSAADQGVYNVAFFEEDVCREGGEPLAEFVSQTKDLHRHLRYHVICGLDATKVTPDLARIFASKQFAALNVEQSDAMGGLDVEPYHRLRRYLKEAGASDRTDRLSGFVWIGRPGDELEQLILNAFQVLQSLGSLILKPYTPIPKSPEHIKYRKYLDTIPHRDWSPHFFPLAEANQITRDEYHDLYRMAAFLNEKVRDRAFDFLDGTLGANLLRESLRKEVWKLEPSPLRVIS